MGAEAHVRFPGPSESGSRTAFLVVDTESVPDGQLLSQVKYENKLTPEEAVERARIEQKETSWNNSDFIPVSFHVPIAVCVARVSPDFTLQAITCLDAPYYRTPEIVKKFWSGVAHYKARLVTYNGRGFDLPLLELAAFREGLSARDYFLSSRSRYGGMIDLHDWITNFGAARFPGGLDLLAKLIGKPGKMEMSGDQVYDYFRAGKLTEINEYCLCDTLDTYFVFLRSRVVTGDITLERETELVSQTREFLNTKNSEFPILHTYLANWQSQ